MQNSVRQAGPHAHTSSHRVTERWEEEEREREGGSGEKGTNGVKV